MTRLRLCFVALAITATSTTSAAAQSTAPALVPIQGFLTDADGVPIDRSVRLDVQLFAEETGGTALFGETHPDVMVDNGNFSIYLGSVDSALDLSRFRDSGDLWLEIIVNAIEVISPRTRLGSVPFAAFAQYCDAATSFGGVVPAVDCADGAVLRWDATAGAFNCEPAVIVTRTTGNLPDVRLVAVADEDLTANPPRYGTAPSTWVDVAQRVLTFDKRYAGSLLKITYQDQLGQYGSRYRGCRWRVLLDGAQISDFSAADANDGTNANNWKMENAAHQTWVQDIAAGQHEVKVQWMGDRGAWSETGQCLSGWSTSGNFLSVEEHP